MLIKRGNLLSECVACIRSWFVFLMLFFSKSGETHKNQAQTDGFINPTILLLTETKEAFALFDKKGTGTISRESLGDLLRALGQNPTQAEVAELAASAPRDIDFATFSAILNRPGGFSPAGTAEDFIRGFRVFDKDGNGYIAAGELRYVLTSLGEKLSDEEVDELMKGVQIESDGRIDYEKFVRGILQQ
ncbi:hypothetical protein PGTUg99_005747 [Puccinia graminis f. sp. tritici]|uniref:EF-hand domain-containing protein n=1 Tax=Puccinia graminis f. sp. tritici TaxID=56615 RepID=A0A5B0S1D5_PUCGR|nr:hypothetical protein PGTUg99_005747 [Puccinia graminis f. sp. tritici]